MCFMQSWNSEFFINLIADWLLMSIKTLLILCSSDSLSSFKKFLSYTAFLTVSASVMYLALHKKKVTVF